MAPSWRTSTRQALRTIRGAAGQDGSEAGSYLRLIDSFITQIKTQGPSRTCNESKEEEEKKGMMMGMGSGVCDRPVLKDQHLAGPAQRNVFIDNILVYHRDDLVDRPRAMGV